MKIMQRSGLKFLVLMAAFFLNNYSIFGQASTHRLAIADSLFGAKHYVESFEHYQSILTQKQYSPATLLKMAYIQEGLNRIGPAMYYLNLYFITSNDKSALDKMEQMAKKFNLKGYEANDSDWFLSFYHDYYFQITVFLIVLSLFIASMIFYTKVKLNRKPIATGIFLFVMLSVFFVHVNFGDRLTEAIVSQQNTYVMKGPSAGAPVVEIIDEGHRVEVLGKNDVWLKILWNNEDAYVKENALMRVRL